LFYTSNTNKEIEMSVQTIVAEVKAEAQAFVTAVEAGLEKLNPFAHKAEAAVEGEVAVVQADAAPEVAKVEAAVTADATADVAKVEAVAAPVVQAAETKVETAVGAAASDAAEKAVESVLPKA
jgi:hypothetical protein